MPTYARLDDKGNIVGLSLTNRPQQILEGETEIADNDPRIAEFQAKSVPKTSLGISTLAAALIAKGVLTQGDIDSAQAKATEAEKIK